MQSAFRVPAHVAHRCRHVVRGEERHPAALVILQPIPGSLYLDQPVAAFGRLVRGPNKVTRTLTITNNSDQTLKLEKLPSPPGQPFSAELKAIEDGKKYEMTVTLDPTKLNRPLLRELVDKYGYADYAAELDKRDGWPLEEDFLTGGMPPDASRDGV